MINVKAALAHLEAQPGEAVGLSKSQMREMLGEIARGQQARRTLSTLAAAAAAGIGAVA